LGISRENVITRATVRGPILVTKKVPKVGIIGSKYFKFNIL